MELVLLALAIAPGLAICIFIYWKDKFDPEPKKYLIYSFFHGVLSAIPAVLLSMGLQNLFSSEGHETLGTTAVDAFISVAFAEELAKFSFLMIAFRRKVFNEPFDGITYAVMVSMGFATIENILYVAQGGIGVAILRIFTAVPAHATFGVLMGYFVGLAKFKGIQTGPYLLLGLITAILFHGAYDFGLFTENGYFIIFGALASLVVGIILSLKAIRIHQEGSPFRINIDL
jgi:RsiW-degrading membrane proteinase PrsW (M82 family)